MWLEPGVGDSIAQDPMAPCTLQRFASAREVVPEFGRSQLADVTVVVALARDLVTSGRHQTDELGHRVRHPTQHEERCAGLELVEQVECASSTPFDAPFESVPLTPLNQAIE